MRTLDLINAINAFDNSNETFHVLKDAICEISENTDLKNKPLVKELLFIASNKLRTFGYNFMNGISLEEISMNTEENLDSLEYGHYVINEYYSSKTGKLLDKEQKVALDRFREKKRLFLSAPTSFGKTFILREIILENNESFNSIILIFPTLSLLNENVHDFRKFINELSLDYKIINNTHMEFDPSGRNIFILTPERMLKLIDQHPALRMDFFFMDEVYKIDNFFNLGDNNDINQEDERDKVFRITLYYLSNRVSNFYLAGPYINLDSIGEGLRRYQIKYDVTFFQVKKELIKKEYFEVWKSKIIIDNDVVSLKGLSKEDKFKTILSKVDSSNLGATIIYGASKNDLSKLARNGIETLPSVEMNTPGLVRFKNHLERRYSVNHNGVEIRRLWTFINGLNHQIGIHHGAFPKYVQNEILQLFNDGEIKYLFATTSITEGVNTKAKNILFHGGSKGGKPLKGFDIKNINGRAGRYYHHFRGRIFYFNKAVADKANELDERLDFITFSDNEIPAVDLDNTNIEDLSQINKNRKEERERQITDSGVSKEILMKNRLVDQLKQIELIRILESKNTLELTEMVTNCTSISAFLKGNMLYAILNYFYLIQLLTEFEWKAYGKIASDYSSKNGMYNLIQYELSNLGEQELSAENIDKVYVNVFTNIRNVVEFKVPKYLSIFGGILEYVCSQPRNAIDTSSMAMDSIIRFFELGVRSDFGTYLAESGFPIPTIKDLERANIDIMNKTFEQIVAEFEQLKAFFQQQLDEYEYYLLYKVLF